MIDRIAVSQLIDIYGGLLSEKQRDMLEMYCDDDLSLSEIGENIGITRQGVRDAIVKAANILTGAEKKLGAAAKIAKIKAIAGEIKNSAESERIKALAAEISEVF